MKLMKDGLIVALIIVVIVLWYSMVLDAMDRQYAVQQRQTAEWIHTYSDPSYIDK